MNFTAQTNTAMKVGVVVCQCLAAELIVSCGQRTCASNIFQNQQVVDTRYLWKQDNSRKDFFKKNILLLLCSLLDYFIFYCGYLALFNSYGSKPIICLPCLKELLLLTWLTSLSTWFKVPCLHKCAFYVLKVVNVGVSCHKNDLYQFLLVCLSLSTSQMLVVWCNNCTGVCYRDFKVALTRRKAYSHCILQRSLWQVSAQIQWCWPWPCFALYKLYKVLSWSCCCVCMYALATDERQHSA